MYGVFCKFDGVIHIAARGWMVDLLVTSIQMSRPESRAGQGIF